jgi:hypothetical protein
LTGKSAPAPRPRWYLDLLNDGAVVQLKLKIRTEQPAEYIMDAEEVEIEDERKVRGFQKDLRAKLPQLVPWVILLTATTGLTLMLPQTRNTRIEESGKTLGGCSGAHVSCASQVGLDTRRRTNHRPDSGWLALSRV